MARDIVLIAVVIFTIGIALFTIHSITNTALDAMISVPTISENNATVTALQETKELTNRFDYIIFVVFIALALALIITGWFIGGIPIFMLIYFIVAVITVIISAMLANIWDAYSNASVFGLTVAAFPITSHILSNLPIYMSIVSIVGVLVMFAKPYFMGEQGW